MSQNCHRSYNLGENNNKKKEIKAPSPKNNEEFTRKPNRAIFSIIEMGAMGGLDFSFDLSKIVGSNAHCRCMLQCAHL